ncbi:hypothetical protein ANN_17834 [Periplaneta americana]|uniref:Uncharacterized protein n=1 Tax=Periplaneta americana TaxID=6978 RepID=A0ABQ8SV17_PERAM|nr:hypothetical protein ANN_17834 [Periplaneta americana]
MTFLKWRSVIKAIGVFQCCPTTAGPYEEIAGNREGNIFRLYLGRSMLAELPDVLGRVREVEVAKRTPAACGLSERTVYRILNEKREADESGRKVSTPGKKRPKRTPTKTNIHSFTAAAIKRQIYSLYKTDFSPSVEDIRDALDKSGLFYGSKWSVRDGMIDKAVDRFVISLDSDSDDDDGDDNVEVEESATAHTNNFMESVCLLPPSLPQMSGQPGQPLSGQTDEDGQRRGDGKTDKQVCRWTDGSSDVQADRCVAGCMDEQRDSWVD